MTAAVPQPGIAAGRLRHCNWRMDKLVNLPEIVEIDSPLLRLDTDLDHLKFRRCVARPGMLQWNILRDAGPY